MKFGWLSKASFDSNIFSVYIDAGLGQSNPIILTVIKNFLNFKRNSKENSEL